MTPDHYRAKAWRVIVCLLACFWIAAALSVSVWDWAFTTMEGTR